MNETVVTGGVMYADEGPYTIDVRHLCLATMANFAMADFEENVEEMVGMTREAAFGDRVQRGRDRRSQGRDRRQDDGDGW